MFMGYGLVLLLSSLKECPKSIKQVIHHVERIVDVEKLEVGLAPSTVHTQLNRLEQKGLVRRFVAKIKPDENDRDPTWKFKITKKGRRILRAIEKVAT